MRAIGPRRLGHRARLRSWRFTAQAASEPATAAAPAPEPPAVVPMDARAELLVARGEVFHELLLANAGGAPELVPAVPTVPVVTLEPGAHWTPLDDDRGPSLRSGWPFDSRTAEPAGAERPVVGG